MNEEILEHLMEYLQQKIDSGEHKIFYNDLMYDEKTIDCINAVNDILKEKEILNNCNKKAIRLIRDNYSNPDGEIWHKDIEKILIILEGRDFNENKL